MSQQKRATFKDSNLVSEPQSTASNPFTGVGMTASNKNLASLSNSNSTRTKDIDNNSSNFSQLRQRRQSGIGSMLRGGLKPRQTGGFGAINLSRTNNSILNRLQTGDKNHSTQSHMSEQIEHQQVEVLSLHEEEKQKREKQRQIREHNLWTAFKNLQSNVTQQLGKLEIYQKSDKYDIEKQQNNIKQLTLVKILAQYEEFCEYENIFTRNEKAIIITQDLNKRIKDLVAEMFKGVKFFKDYQETSNEQKGKNFDSDQEYENYYDSSVEYVKDTDIINCNDFHDELERRLRERDRQNQWRDPNYLSNNNSLIQKIKGLDKVEQNVSFQSKLMLAVINRILKTMHSQLSGESNIVQCFLLEIKDFKDMQANVDIGQLKKFHRECYQELKKLVYQIQVDRFMIFLFEYMPVETQKLSRKKKYSDENATVNDFLIRSCTKMLKRICKFILAFNYLIVHRNMVMLSEVCSHLKIFIIETCDLLIEKLSIFHFELQSTHNKYVKEQEILDNQGLNKNNETQDALANQIGHSIFQTRKTIDMTKGLNNNADQTSLKGTGKNKNLKGGAGYRQKEKAKKENQSKVTFTVHKLKLTKRALNITKTLFGMVDEMDQTDFCAQKESAGVVLLKEKSVDQTNQTSDEIDAKEDQSVQKSSDIVDLVTKIETEMGNFKYSKLKPVRKTQNSERTISKAMTGPINSYSNYLQDSTHYEPSSDLSSSTTLDQSGSLKIIHAPEYISMSDVRGAISQQSQQRRTDESSDDFLGKYFIDPFKYHQLAKEADHVNKLANFQEFRGYVDNDKLTKRSPAVTFGKGGRRPTTNRIAVEESSLPQLISEESSKKDPKAEEKLMDEDDLDLTQIPHQNTASELALREVMTRDQNFFSIREEGTTYDDEFLEAKEEQKQQKTQSQDYTPEEDNFVQQMIQQYKKELGGQFISQSRLEAFTRQVIPKEKLQDIMRLQENKSNNFQEILSNLLFSANNPFQAEIAQIHDLAFQQKTEALKKHDYVDSGSLAYIFFSKHLTYKQMMKHFQHNDLKQRSTDGMAEGHALSNVNSNDHQAAMSVSSLNSNNNLSHLEGVNSGLSDDFNQRATMSDFQKVQMQDNMQYAMSRASRFLDTSLKVSELENREKIYEFEIDVLIEEEENQVQQEELYDSLKPKKSDEVIEAERKLKQEKEGDESTENSEVDPQMATNLRKRKTRRELQKEASRISRLLNMHTTDFKFYRPTHKFARSGSIPFRKDPFQPQTNLFYNEYSRDGEEDKRNNDRDNEIKEMEVKQAKYLLMRMRNQEMKLRKSTFDREKKGFDDYMFEANSQQHKQGIRQEQDALKNVIKSLSTQYKKQLDWRDPILNEYIEDGHDEYESHQDSFIQIDPADLDREQREYEQTQQQDNNGMLGIKKQLTLTQMHNFNTSKENLGGKNQPISMLEMAFNEINPYRENQFGMNASNDYTENSMNLKSGSVGQYGQITDLDSLHGGGSMKNLGKIQNLLTQSELEENAQDAAAGKGNKQVMMNNSFSGPEINDDSGSFFKMRASEQITQRKRHQIGAILNPNKANNNNNKNNNSNTYAEENQFISNTSSVPKENKQYQSNSAEQLLDPAFVMGMGIRRAPGTGTINSKFTGGIHESLNESALIQFQELTGLGQGNDVQNSQAHHMNQQSSAGFGNASYQKSLADGTLSSSMNKKDNLETPKQKRGGKGEEDHQLIEDIDGGYTPEWQEPIKNMILKKQRTRTMQ